MNNTPPKSEPMLVLNSLAEVAETRAAFELLCARRREIEAKTSARKATAARKTTAKILSALARARTRGTFARNIKF